MVAPEQLHTREGLCMVWHALAHNLGCDFQPRCTAASVTHRTKPQHTVRHRSSSICVTAQAATWQPKARRCRTTTTSSSNVRLWDSMHERCTGLYKGCAHPMFMHFGLAGIDDLREKREEIVKTLKEDEQEKSKIQADLQLLTKRLAQVNDSIARKVCRRWTAACCTYSYRCISYCMQRAGPGLHGCTGCCIHSTFCETVSVAPAHRGS